MTAATTAKRGASTPRKAARRTANGNGHTNGNAAKVPEDTFVPPTALPKPAEPPAHPVYGTRKLYSYQPQAGGEPIVFPHISTCRPTALFFYDNRHKDEMRQAFAWMDLCGIPDEIGRRVFMLPPEEQGTLLKEWFAGLNITPQQGVAPPGES